MQWGHVIFTTRTIYPAISCKWAIHDTDHLRCLWWCQPVSVRPSRAQSNLSELLTSALFTTLTVIGWSHQSVLDEQMTYKQPWMSVLNDFMIVKTVLNQCSTCSACWLTMQTLHLDFWITPWVLASICKGLWRVFGHETLRGRVERLCWDQFEYCRLTLILMGWCHFRGRTWCCSVTAPRESRSCEYIDESLLTQSARVQTSGTIFLSAVFEQSCSVRLPGQG